MPTRSAAFERFRFSFFEDPDSARQGLDTPALAGLVGEERERAEAMLIAFLPDSRAIIGLGVLGSSKAEPHLAALFEAERSAQRAAKLEPEASWLPDRLLHLATALWRIRPDRRWPLAAIDVLGSASEPIERQEAAEALHDVRDPGAVQALVKALDDPEPLVRYHAARGLFAIHGLSAESKDPQHMLYRLMADEASRREGGKRDILAAVAAAALKSVSSASAPVDRGG
ncbi:MAG: HEAT repeat domain-containing protein, partial [Microvirga sp.]